MINTDITVNLFTYLFMYLHNIIFNIFLHDWMSVRVLESQNIWVFNLIKKIEMFGRLYIYITDVFSLLNAGL